MVREWWSGTPRTDKVRLVAAVLVALVVTGAYEVQKHRDGGRAAAAGLPTTGVAADLTAVQLGHRPGPRNAMLRRIDSLLELLEGDCPANTRPQLGALTREAIRTLGRDGISVAPNGVLGGVVGSTTIGSTSDCRSFFAGYVARTRRRPPRA
jgi:hypothetical protein